MKTRVMTALAIILVVALPVAFGGWLLELLALFILLSTAFEWMHVRRDFNSVSYTHLDVYKRQIMIY